MIIFETSSLNLKQLKIVVWEISKISEIGDDMKINQPVKETTIQNINIIQKEFNIMETLRNSLTYIGIIHKLFTEEQNVLKNNTPPKYKKILKLRNEYKPCQKQNNN